MTENEIAKELVDVFFKVHDAREVRGER